jgi:hypothetical protein
MPLSRVATRRRWRSFQYGCDVRVQHLRPSVFRRYDIVSESDLRAAARALDAVDGAVGTTIAQ